jgi:flagellin
MTSALQNSLSQLLGTNERNLSRSMAALAAGNRLTSASTDISALSIATGLQTQVSTLRAASMNIAQASSFLQVADGGLSQTSSILERMQALSVQANSGALSDSAREGLNIEFQNLAEEMDRISGGTSFNGVNLLDGSLGGTAELTTGASTGTQASGSLDFAANIGAGETVVLNGITLTEGVDFTAGATAQATVGSLATALNNDSRFDGFSFSGSGSRLEITADAAGEAGNQFTIDQAASTATFSVNGDALTGAGVYSLSGGANDGISAGDTTASGSINDSLLTGGTGSAASTRLSFSTESDIQAGDTIQIDDGEGGFTTFTFTSGAPASATDIQIGSSLEETLQNAASAINDYSGAGDYGTRQLTATVDGNALQLTGNVNGDLTDASGAALDIALGTSGGSISTAQLNNGTTGGVDTTGVTNAGFTGTIQGFEATYTGADQATVSIEVGGETYTAAIGDTTPGTDTTVRFTSENGGYFDVTLSGGNGVSVSDQAGADALADRFDAAFSGLEFSQTREVSSYEGTGQLVGSSLEITGSDFGDLNVESVRVQGGPGGTASVEIEINGETYRTGAGLGTSIGAGESVTLTSTSDPNRSLTFTNGENEIDLSTNADAAEFQSSLEEALGAPDGNGASFQIGSSSEEVTNLTIGDVSRAGLFGGQSLDLLSADNASAAFDAIGEALNRVISERANVGSFQSALDYAAASVDTAIQNQDAARAALEDTDIAEESTRTALLTVLRQAQLASLAQSNRMSANLLRLVE